MRTLPSLIACIAIMHSTAGSISAQQPTTMKVAAPDFKGIETWINSKPLSMKELRGKVVALHFWTFG